MYSFLAPKELLPLYPPPKKVKHILAKWQIYFRNRYNYPSHPQNILSSPQKNLLPAVTSREQETFVFGNAYAFNYFSSAKYLMVRTIWEV